MWKDLSMAPTPLRLALLHAERTQRSLAEELGVSEPVMSRYVNGLHPPKDLKREIARRLRRTGADLGWPEIDDSDDLQVAA